MNLDSAIVVRAQGAGLEFVEVAGRVEVRKGKKVISFHTDPKKALDKALERLESDRLRVLDPLPSDREPVLHIPARKKPPRRTVPPDLPPDLAPAEIVAAPLILVGADVIPVEAVKGPVKGSIIKPKYVSAYRKNNGSCGDLMSDELKAYLSTPQGLDLVKLKEVAVANDVWRDTYSRLNAGQQRMNVGNRLRQKHLQGDPIDIGGAVFQMEFKDV